jgi:ATP-dependent helicase/nuclease subunit A
VQKAFDRVRLNTSFRSLQTVLDAVDLVFAQPQLQTAVLAIDQIQHVAARPDKGGAVTLWPPVRADLDGEAEREWPTEIAQSSKSAPRQVAERIARTVRSWIESRRPLGVRATPVTANDVMILVQSRGALFNEIIRALHAENLPTPGADRLAVTSHIAVLDLLALGDVLLNADDDLQLAAILRSPLFDVTEEELFALAQPRPEHMTLYRALGQSGIPSCKDAYERLHRWRGQLDFDRPYWFFAQVLYKEGGLRRFHCRFGLEVDDIFAEFLQLAIAHEQESQPSLQGFVCAMRERAVSIKRELAERGSGVRVMTVHGAKGLEAPIVILADATSKPSSKQTTRSLYVADGNHGPMLFHAPSKADHLDCTMAIREAQEQRQIAEYWRKLYVGMTRAEDELFITGALGARDKGEGTWYEAVREALSSHCEAVPDPMFGEHPVLVYPAERPAPTLEPRAMAALAPSLAPLSFAPLPPPLERPVIHPSRERGEPIRVLDTSAESTIGAETARKEGIALHALLQHLAKIAPDQRLLVADKAIPVLLPETPERHGVLVDKALSILSRPELTELFGPEARAEVPFAVNALRNGKPVRLSGRIDRLVVSGDRVLIVDYKSDAAPPSRADQVDGNYRVQLGLYALVAAQLFPQKTVSAAILWTSLESLMILPADLVEAAGAAFTLE